MFNQFRHMKNLPLPESEYFQKLPPPPSLCDGPKILPPSTQNAAPLGIKN